MATEAPSLKIPEIDRRRYRHLELPNKLSVILIQDPESHTAAASMSVGVGNYQDPEATPGLAHFLEHMLFMGTEKYPDENDYQEYLSHHGGWSNAYTDDEYTNYHFSVQESHLEGALDRFAQFFIAPLMKEDAVSREMKAVEAEHEKNIQNDGWREYRISSFLLAPHPAQHFGTGNLETLDHPDIRDRLLKFYQQYYSANRMKLTIYGTQALDQLEQWTRGFFEAIPNRDLPANSLPAKELVPKKLLRFRPIQDEDTLTLFWPLPPTQEWYPYKVINFLEHLIGHEGEGSIFHLLKDQQLIGALMAGEILNDSSGGVFHLQVTLTRKGIKEIPLIIASVDQYLDQLRASRKEWSTWYQEMQQMNRLSFRFQSKDDPDNYCVDLSQSQQKYPWEDVLYWAYRTDPYGEKQDQLLEQLLSRMTPEHRSLMLGSQQLSEAEAETEKWYGIKYRLEEVPDWSWSGDSALWEKLHLPRTNPYLVSPEIQLLPIPSTRPMPATTIHNQELWFQIDHQFQQPRLIGGIYLRNPEMKKDPVKLLSLQMLASLTKSYLNNHLYYASLAHLFIEVFYSEQGLYLEWSSYRKQYQALLQTVIKIIQEAQFPESLWKLEYQDLQRTLENMKYMNPLQQAQEALLHRMVVGRYRYTELLEALEQVTPITVQQVARMTFQGRISTILIGDLSLEELDYFEALFPKIPEMNQCGSLSQYRTVHEVKEPWQLVEPSYNPEESNGAIIYEFRLGYIKPGITPGWNKRLAYLDLLSKFLGEPFFDQLRSKEQLGYLVRCSQKSYGESEYPMQVLQMIIQSPSRPPEYLKERIDSFLAQQQEKMKTLSKEKFEKMKSALSRQYREPDQTLSQRFNRLVYQVLGQHYLFELRELMAQTLPQVTLEELQRAYQHWLVDNPHQGQVMIQPRVKKETTSEADSEGETDAEMVVETPEA